MPNLSLTFTSTEPTVIQAAAGDYRIQLAPINQISDDFRVIVGTLGWRDTVPLMFSDSEQAHEDARFVGNIVDIRLETIGETQWAVGGINWDSTELAREAQRLVDEGRFTGSSIHIGKGRFADVCPIEGGGFKEVEFPEDWVAEEVDGELVSFDPPCEPLLLGMFEVEIAASSIVAVPAFPEAQIAKEGIEPIAASTIPIADAVTVNDWVVPTLDGNVESDGKTWEGKTMGEIMGDIIQSAASLDRPPKDWFDYPELDGPTPLTVTDDGQVFGHLAVWDTCHTGFQGKCVQPPRDSDYSYFQTARVITSDGSRIPVGPLVVDDGHAPASWSIEKVMRYYSDTRLAAAYVTIKSGEFGPWAAGAVSHKATPGQVETLRRHALSGDWRKSDGVTRLIAAVSVNGPGFVVPEVLHASGEEVGLVTYGPEPIVDEPSDLALVAAALVRLTELVESKQPVVNNVTVIESEPAELSDEDLEAEVEVALLLDA